MGSKTIERSYRGKVLTIYLAIMFMSSGVNLYSIITGRVRELPFHADYPEWMFYWLTVANIIGIICLYGMWKMKKWGVFGSIALMIIGNCIILYFRQDSDVIMISAIGIIIFALVIWSPYKRMT